LYPGARPHTIIVVAASAYGFKPKQISRDHQPQLLSAEAINKKGYDDQMREMLAEAEPGFQWYLIHRVWESVKQAPWSDVLSYFIGPS